MVMTMGSRWSKYHQEQRAARSGGRGSDSMSYSRQGESAHITTIAFPDECHDRKFTPAQTEARLLRDAKRLGLNIVEVPVSQEDLDAEAARAQRQIDRLLADAESIGLNITEVPLPQDDESDE
jgi:hypothetical protein